MNNEINNSLSALEQRIAELKNECRKIAFETLNILIDRYPECKDEIMSAFTEICKRQNVDFFSGIRVSGDEIVDYIENNVKKIEP